MDTVSKEETSADSNPSPQAESKKKMDTVSKEETSADSNPSPQAESDEKYKMDYPEKGLCVIISMENFSNRSDQRKGAIPDEKSVENVFKKIGFQVQIEKDKKSQQIYDIMAKVAKEDHSKRSCFVCVVMSHGKEGEFCCYDKSFEDQRLFELFNGENSRSLAGKPKLFFLQKCNGTERDLGVTRHGKPKAKVTKIPTEADFLYHYATCSGYVAYRRHGSGDEDGSWFVQSLCDLLGKYWNKKELLHILTLVNHKVAVEYETKDQEKYKQMPCFVSTLTKNLYLY